MLLMFGAVVDDGVGDAVAVGCSAESLLLAAVGGSECKRVILRDHVFCFYDAYECVRDSHILCTCVRCLHELC